MTELKTTKALAALVEKRQGVERQVADQQDQLADLERDIAEALVDGQPTTKLESQHGKLTARLKGLQRLSEALTGDIERARHDDIVARYEQALQGMAAAIRTQKDKLRALREFDKRILAERQEVAKGHRAAVSLETANRDRLQQLRKEAPPELQPTMQGLFEKYSSQF